MTNGQVDNHLKGSGLGPDLTAHTQKTKVIKDFNKQTKPHKGTKENKKDNRFTISQWEMPF